MADLFLYKYGVHLYDKVILMILFDYGRYFPSSFGNYRETTKSLRIASIAPRANAVVIDAGGTKKLTANYKYRLVWSRSFQC